MICPYCKFEDTKVLDTRIAEDSLRRRRECEKCEKRFTTYERVERIELAVIKKDGRREAFDREKLKNGILKACEKRPVSHEKIEETVNKIENKLKLRKGREVSSQLIGEEVMKVLNRLDKIAYIRFASVYRDFADVSAFEKELKNLMKK